jgi:hypothetical protein
LLAADSDAGLARAEELNCSLCAEEPENERLWTALFGIHEWTGSALGLVRLRSGRCVYADPPPPTGPKVGRPQRYGHTFACADERTW